MFYNFYRYQNLEKQLCIKYYTKLQLIFSYPLGSKETTQSLSVTQLMSLPNLLELVELIDLLNSPLNFFDTLNNKLLTL